VPIFHDIIPELEFPDDEHKKVIHKTCFDEIEVFKQYKIAQYRRILSKFVDFKYSISLKKGFKMFFEAVILITMMFAVVHKSNLYSIFYFILIIRLIFVGGDHKN
jgi:hypothetical protein